VIADSAFADADYAYPSKTIQKEVVPQHFTLLLEVWHEQPTLNNTRACNVAN